MTHEKKSNSFKTGTYGHLDVYAGRPKIASFSRFTIIVFSRENFDRSDVSINWPPFAPTLVFKHVFLTYPFPFVRSGRVWPM